MIINNAKAGHHGISNSTDYFFDITRFQNMASGKSKQSRLVNISRINIETFPQ